MTATAASDTKSKKWLWLALIFGAVALAVLLTLGTWQVQRLAWKEGLLATIEERTKATPLTLPELMAQFEDGEDIEYVPVKTEGYFDHDNEQHFFATFDGQSGYYIYTPLMLEKDRYVFVNRGFVPYELKDPSSRPETLVSFAQDVVGLARKAPDAKAGWVVPENDVEKNVFHWKDMDAMIARTGKPAEQFLPFFIDQNRNANRSLLPIGGVTLINLPNNHLQYAITWYGLAMTLIGVLGYYLIRYRRGS